MVKGLKLNPDKDIVKAVKERLKITGGYCPCIPEQTTDTKCICKDARENGICHCSLFVPVDNGQ
jgi:ferredoxin-thioredoxin reductase catalytic subunit